LRRSALCSLSTHREVLVHRLAGLPLATSMATVSLTRF